MKILLISLFFGIVSSCGFPFVYICGTCMYIDIKDSGTWNQTRDICKAFGSIYDIAKIDDLSCMHSIVQYLRSYHMDRSDIWIGGTDEAYEGNWRWVTEENMELGTPYWAYNASGQAPFGGPNKNCAFLDQKNYYYFNDGDCQDVKNVICEKKSLIGS